MATTCDRCPRPTIRDGLCDGHPREAIRRGERRAEWRDNARYWDTQPGPGEW